MSAISNRIIRMWTSRTNRANAIEQLAKSIAGTVSIPSSQIARRETEIIFASGTGACTVNIADVTNCAVGDVMNWYFTAGGSTLTITPGTNIIDGGNLVIATTKRAFIQFKYNGSILIETKRFIEP